MGIRLNFHSQSASILNSFEFCTPFSHYFKALIGFLIRIVYNTGKKVKQIRNDASQLFLVVISSNDNCSMLVSNIVAINNFHTIHMHTVRMIHFFHTTQQQPAAHWSIFLLRRSIRLRLSSWMAEKQCHWLCREEKRALQLSSEIDRSNYIAFFSLSAHNSNGLDDGNDDYNDDKTKEARNEMRNGFDWLCREWMKKCNAISIDCIEIPIQFI